MLYLLASMAKIRKMGNQMPLIFCYKRLQQYVNSDRMDRTFRHNFLLEIRNSSDQGYRKHQYYEYFPSTLSTRCTRRSKTN